MIRLVIPLFALTATLWVIVFVLHRSDRRKVLRESLRLSIAFAAGALVLLLISVIFLIVENVK